MAKTILVIVQARLSSSRLPGKVLLPISNIPIVVLAARRAGNNGLGVRVATSTDKTDDPVAYVSQEHGIPVVRGPLNDVLGRFVIATKDLSDDDIVVRLTADNVFPDGQFINELVAAFEKDRRDYLGTGSPDDGLPYGLSAEALYVRTLRVAGANATSQFDREHVTPWVRRQYSGPSFRPSALRDNLSHLSCTIDSLDDYQRVADVFSKAKDAVGISWNDLCAYLSEITPQPQIRRRAGATSRSSELTLGTAQLGVLNYGRTNTVGRPDFETAVCLVREAVKYGINHIDTARGYDRAEQVLGDALKPYGDRIRVITKLDPLDDLTESATDSEVRRAVDASVFRSCRELGLASLPVLLLHRWRHFAANRGIIWRRLCELKINGVINVLGASVSAPAEAVEALAVPEIQHLQLPFNLLDHRWLTAGIDRLAMQRSDVTIHARSILLQGILGASPKVWPRVPGVSAEALVRDIDDLARRLGRSNRIDVCIAFVRAQSWIHSLVMGVETISQLHDLINWFQRPPLDDAEQAEITQSLYELPETFLNPALWMAA